ncbi:hypothetical protein BDN70DRAFT_895093 [Pholiota conissans]|uniref:Uncharacterized protein n=1 Tax=Pholiota conissans TaxID=109636 RepID=A0A9P5Z4C3_9AGAR|nr:hypothetical protein BDN70DRAFT_895093 [Pholiota conissans]
MTHLPEDDHSLQLDIAEHLVLKASGLTQKYSLNINELEGETSRDETCGDHALFGDCRNPHRLIDSGVVPQLFPTGPLHAAMPGNSQTTVLSQSAISKIPYDVVQEILVHCSHLFYTLEVDVTPTKIASTSAYRQRQIKFLLWWDKNRGSIPLSICISVNEANHASPEYKYLKTIWVDGDSEAVKSALKFITSAQYLNPRRGFWQEIRRRIDGGDQIFFPNLRTIMQEDPDSDFASDQKLIGSVADANNVLPSLRLSLYYGDAHTTIFPSNFSCPSHWSALTHICFFAIEAVLDFWPSFICGVPNLQWAYIFSRGHVDEEGINREPVEYTHAHLATLWLVLHHDHLSPSSLFARLHLPALQELTLHFQSSSRSDPDDGIVELYSILQSTPNITTLGLTDTFLNLRGPEYYPPESQSIHPIWNDATHLIHLRWEVFVFENRRGLEESMEELFELFVDHITIDAKWLQLDNPRCPIRKVTFVDAESPGFETCNAFQVFEMMPSIDVQIASTPAIYYIYNNSRRWGQNL